MTEKDLVDLGELNVFGIGFTEYGAPLPVKCAGCGKKLTVIFLNNKCAINIEIECNSCGYISIAKDLRAELQGRSDMIK